MRDLFTLIGSLMLVAMVWTGTTAHAAEAMGCVEVSFDAAGHFDGDRDQVPADQDKGVSHHHGGCHGHHVGVTADTEGLGTNPAACGTLSLRRTAVASGCDPGTALRPPIA